MQDLLVALDQFVRMQKKTGKKINWWQLQRKDMIVDMEKPRNFLKWLWYAYKLAGMKKLLCISFHIFCLDWCLFISTNRFRINKLPWSKILKHCRLSRMVNLYKGMFPAYRECDGFPHNYQPDNNIFFTAITAFTLNKLTPILNR